MPNLLALAETRLREGRADIAEAVCTQLTANALDDAPSQWLLGRALLHREGPAPRAVAALREARRLVPASLDIAGDLGIALLRQGEVAAAAESFATALQDDPTNDTMASLARLPDILNATELPPDDVLLQLSADELLLLARSLIVLNRAAEAQRPLNLLAAAGELTVSALPSLARSLAAAGDLIGSLRVAWDLWRGVADEIPFRRRMFGTEIEMLCRALAGPLADEPIRQVLLALVLLDTAERRHEGIAVLNQVLTTGSDLPDAFLAAGIAYLRQGEFAAALEMIDQALKLDPAASEAARLRPLALWAADGGAASGLERGRVNDLVRLAEGLCAASRLADATEVLERAQADAPDREDIGLMRADLLMVHGRLGDAAPVVDACLKIHPVEPRAGMHLATLALSEGRLTDGWQHFENRFKYWRRDTPPREFTVPRWTGDDPAGRRLMVWREEGVGDEIRFASCVPELLEKGFSEVIFECAPRLQSLFRHSFNGVHVRGEKLEDAPVDYDVHVPLFSLPALLRSGFEDFPDRRTYLRPEESPRRIWAEALRDCGDGPYVGVCWRSLNDSWLKKPFHSALSDWAPVLSLAGVTFINLQVEATPDELTEATSRFGAKIHQLDNLDLHDDFNSVAAVMAELDAVVSARCWIPILSGALGVATYCFAAPFNPYFLGRDPDPWMPAVHTFQRGGHEDWQGPMTAIAGALGEDLDKLR